MTEISSIFDDYSREIESLTLTVSKNLAEAQLRQGASRVTSFHHAEEAVSEAAAVLQSMEMELFSLSGNAKSKASEKYQRYRDDVSRIKLEVQKMKKNLQQDEYSKDRQSLMESGDTASLDHRAAMMNTTEKLAKSGTRIKESRIAIAETEMLGATILEDLSNQRQTILRAKDNVTEMNDGLVVSDNIIGQMRRRNQLNKIILYGAAIVVVVTVLGLVLYRFLRK